MKGAERSEVDERRGLVDRCIDAAAGSAESVEKWRRQRRTLERLPTQLADALFHRLLRRGLLYPTLLEVFQHCVEEVDLHGENYVNAEWMAYVGAFRYMRILNLEDCRGINNSSLWSITGMGLSCLIIFVQLLELTKGVYFERLTNELKVRRHRENICCSPKKVDQNRVFAPLQMLKCVDSEICLRLTESSPDAIYIIVVLGMTTLRELDLSRCPRITDAGLEHILSISNLEKLCISETKVTSVGIMRLSSLVNLRVLDLGGLPVTDQAMASLQVLTQLEYLDLWGSKVTDQGAAMLNMFPKLNYLNLAWTSVTKLPNLPAMVCLNISNCTIHSIFEGDDTVKAPLSKLFVHNTTFFDVDEALSCEKVSYLSVLDLSYSPICNFNFLANMRLLECLDLSFSQMTDGLIDFVASVGFNLKDLNLSNTKVTSQALCFLAGNVPNLERLSLSKTSIDDASLQFLSMMPSLRILDLSKTSIKGFCYLEGSKVEKTSSLALLQNLVRLENLNLEETQVRDEAVHDLVMLGGLKYLYLKSDFLSDISLNAMSSLPNLTYLGLQGAVLTNQGLYLFRPPGQLHVLDLRGCWLLSKDSVASFCEDFPQIEVRHELVRTLPTDQNVQLGSSPMHRTTPEEKLKRKAKNPGQSPCRLRKDHFADERIKYSKEELLELQFSPLSDPLANLHTVLPKGLMKE